MDEFDKKEIIRCRFCLRYKTCKRNKHNSSSCRLYEQDDVAYGKYREELEIKSIETRKRMNSNPITREFMEYTDLILNSMKK